MLWITATFLAAGIATETEAPENTSPEPTCPALLAESSDELNGLGVEQRFAGEFRVFVLTHEHVEDPTLLRANGMQLLDVDLENKTATLEITEPLEGCDEGHYTLQEGDPFTAEGAVIAIVEGAVLISYQEELRFLRMKDAPRRDWEAVWGSKFAMNPYLAKKSRGPQRNARGKKKPRRRKR